MNKDSISIAFASSIGEEKKYIIEEILGKKSIFNSVKPVVTSIASSTPIGSLIIGSLEGTSEAKKSFEIVKLYNFLYDINENLIENNKVEEYKEKFSKNENFASKELEYLMIILERLNDIDKSRLLAKLFIAYIDGIICLEELKSYCEITVQLLPIDFKYLKDFNGMMKTFNQNIQVDSSILRLQGLGFVYELTNNSPFTRTGDHSIGVDFSGMQRVLNENRNFFLTDFAKKYLEIIK